MFKMEIAFDEEKIERENKYDLAKMWAKVDEFMLGKYKLKKTAPGVYSDYPGYDGLGLFMAFATRFEDHDWFLFNLKKWDLLEIDMDYPEDIYREDWLTAKLKRRRLESKKGA